MKKYYISLLLLLSLSELHAQSFRANLILQSGVSIPVGDYAGKNLQNGSFTLPGFTASTEITVLSANRWGGFIQAGFQLNPVDVGDLGYEKVVADPFLDDLYIRSEPFRVIHLMAGPARQWNLSNTISIETQLAAGIFYSSTPYQLYKPDYAMIADSWYEITASSDLSFALGAGVRFIYKLSPCHSLGIQGQLMHSAVSFEFNSLQGPRTDQRNITMVNSSLSLIIRIISPGQEL